MAETLDHEEAYSALIRARDVSPALYNHSLAMSRLSVLARPVGLEDCVCQGLATVDLLYDANHANIPEAILRPLRELSQLELIIYEYHHKCGLDFLIKQITLP